MQLNALFTQILLTILRKIASKLHNDQPFGAKMQQANKTFDCLLSNQAILTDKRVSTLFIASVNLHKHVGVAVLSFKLPNTTHRSLFSSSGGIIGAGGVVSKASNVFFCSHFCRRHCVLCANCDRRLR